MFELDIDSLLRAKIVEFGGTDEKFNEISDFISSHSQKTDMPEDGIAMIIIDSLGCGCSLEQLTTQFVVYDSKRPDSLLR